MHRTLRALMAVVLGLGLLASACSTDDAASGAEDQTSTSTAVEDTTPEEPAGTAVGAVSETYSDPARWLCRPDITDDACAVDLDSTLVHADGSTEVEPFEAATDAPVDCFYVYPTISGDPGQNSDLVPGDAELGIVANQAARFGSVCEVYAPMYRQIPLGALMSRMSGAGTDGSSTDGSSTDGSSTDGPLEGTASEIAYESVREAFLHFLATTGEDRPFVLIGHSQGAAQLSRLVAEEIDGDEALRERMLSAMLIGIPVAETGYFEHVEPCSEPGDTACVIAYSTFYAGEPPPPDSLFGAVRGQGDTRAVCTNPADPANSGPAPLQTYLPAAGIATGPPIETPFVHYDGLLTGECVADENFDWLEITNTSAGAPGWPSDLGGRLTPQWGTHLMDVNFALGDLVDLVRSQAAAH